MTEQPHEPFDVVAGPRHKLASAAAIILFVAASLQVFQWSHGRDVFSGLELQPGGWRGAIVFAVMLGVLHEVIHAFVLAIAARTSLRSLAVVRSWRKMGLIVRAKLPLPAKAHRRSVLAPLLLLGVVPALAGIAIGQGLLLLWAAFAMLECFADLASFLGTRSVPKMALVLDHPDKLGWRVLGA